MGRLFITPREINFISDITKEIIKDVIGTCVFYYAISELKTQTHAVYNEALKKVFDNPIRIDALVDSNFESDTKIDQFGVDAQFKIEVYVQHRDLIEKGINVNIGDYFSFSDIFYEVSERVFMRNIYGMPEHKDGIKLIGTRARVGGFKALFVGPTDISHPEPGSIQETFVQQRGESETAEGKTGDVRDMVKSGVLDPPLTGPAEVSPRGDEGQGAGAAFYDEKLRGEPCQQDLTQNPGSTTALSHCRLVTLDHLAGLTLSFHRSASRTLTLASLGCSIQRLALLSVDRTVLR